jgi:chorismate-pyruvate lyase
MSAATIPASEHGLLYPLTLFRQRDKRPLPVIEPIDGERMPEPYRSLLVHNGDMTTRLEDFHDASLRLRALHVEEAPHAYRREVLLCTRDADLAVEYGAIEICLDVFTEPLRSEIVEAHLPLGGLLNAYGIEYRSEPRAFFRVLPDLTLCRHFGVEAAAGFYGRSNRLLTAGGAVFARIVEVLRP